MRAFETGATRDLDLNKFDYEGFLSPLVVERFAAYMNEHRRQADGNLRDSDNWQKGMPTSVYMKSMWRHFMDVWKIHRSEHLAPGVGARGIVNVTTKEKEDALCALLFNVQGYLLETMRNETNKD